MKPKQSIRHLKLDQLIGHANNRDLVLERVEEMADSIREHGVLMPLVVTEHPTEIDRWLILDGHHRAAAARLAQLKVLPVVIRHDLDFDVDEQLVVMLVANCQRQELSAIDRAEMLGQLRDKQGMTLTEIARRTGLSVGWVGQSLALLELDQDTRTRVRTGEVGVGQASQAVRQVRASQRDTRLSTATAARTARPRVTVEAAHFTRKHPLAGRVEQLCVHQGVRPIVGGLGCGPCWEQAIRDDAISQGVSA